jgi:hypothetical protein
MMTIGHDTIVKSDHFYYTEKIKEMTMPDITKKTTAKIIGEMAREQIAAAA